MKVKVIFSSPSPSPSPSPLPSPSSSSSSPTPPSLLASYYQGHCTRYDAPDEIGFLSWSGSCRKSAPRSGAHWAKPVRFPLKRKHWVAKLKFCHQPTNERTKEQGGSRRRIITRPITFHARFTLCLDLSSS